MSLSPHTEGSVRYLVQVEAVSGVGCSAIVEQDCYTEERAPPPLSGVESVRLNSTAMNVSWIPPNKAESNGFITGYIVTYFPVTNTGNRRKRQERSRPVGPEASNVIINDLDPGSAYEVGVVSTTAAGTSESESG